MGQPVNRPTRRAAAAAVIENPFAGNYVEDLTELMEIGEELGALLPNRGRGTGHSRHFRGELRQAAAVGENGELEHAAAILHPKLGTPVRKTLVKAPRSFPLPKNAAAPESASTFLSATKMPPLSAATSTAWKFASTTPRAPTKSS